MMRYFIALITWGALCSFFVLCKCRLSWCKFPCDVANEVGRCFKRPGVNPDHVLKWFFFIAFSNVYLTRDKQASCKYWANLVCVFFFWIMIAMDGLRIVTGAYCDVSLLIFLSIYMLSMLSSINWLKCWNSSRSFKSSFFRCIWFLFVIMQSATSSFLEGYMIGCIFGVGYLVFWMAVL